MTVPEPPDRPEQPPDERPGFAERAAAFIAGFLGTVFLTSAMFSRILIGGRPVMAVVFGGIVVIAVVATRRASHRRRTLYAAAAAGIATVVVLWGGCLAILSTVHIRN